MVAILSRKVLRRYLHLYLMIDMITCTVFVEDRANLEYIILNSIHSKQNCDILNFS